MVAAAAVVRRGHWTLLDVDGWPEWRLTDLLDGRSFDHDGDELATAGLYVDLPPWGAHVLAVEPR